MWRLEMVKPRLFIGRFSRRKQLALWLFTGLAVSQMSRLCYHEADQVTLANFKPIAEGYSECDPVQTTAAPSNCSTKRGPETREDEDRRLRMLMVLNGAIYDAMTWGQSLGYLIGGPVADRWGGRWVVITGGWLVGLTTLLAHIVSILLGTDAVFGLRMITGVGRGLIMIGCYPIVAKWFPRSEQFIWATVTFSGMVIGQALSSVMSVFSNYSIGWWPIPFYTFGALMVAWTFVTPWVISSSPFSHPWIPDPEALVLNPYYQECKVRQTPEGFPLGRIMSSRGFWALAFAYLGQLWAYNSLVNRIPEYLSYSSTAHLQDTGYYIGCGFLLMWFFAMLSAAVGHILVQEEIGVGRNNCRRLFMTIGTLGPGAAVVLVMKAHCNRLWQVGWALGGLCWAGAALPPLYVGPIDMGPNHAGTTAALTQAPSTVVIAAYNTWVPVKGPFLLLGSGLVTATAVAYNLFVDSSLQPWDSSESSSPSCDQIE